MVAVLAGWLPAGALAAAESPTPVAVSLDASLVDWLGAAVAPSRSLIEPGVTAGVCVVAVGARSVEVAAAACGAE